MKASKSLMAILSNYSVLSFTKKATAKIEHIAKTNKSEHLIINATKRGGFGYEFQITALEPKTLIMIENEYVKDKNFKIYIADNAVMPLWNSTLDYNEEDNCFKEIE